MKETIQAIAVLIFFGLVMGWIGGLVAYDFFPRKIYISDIQAKCEIKGGKLNFLNECEKMIKIDL